MTLWLLLPCEGCDGLDGDHPWASQWDTMRGFVIRAESEVRARALAQQSGSREVREGVPAWTSERYSTCIEITGEGDEAVLLTEYWYG